MTSIRFCHFDDTRNLTYHELDIDDKSSRFIAISHLWTDQTSWMNVPGFPERVLASNQKAKFIREKLPDLVGKELFWMDILAIDQTDPAAVMSLVAHIPSIYSRAERTIVIREAGGFQSCCEKLYEQQYSSSMYGEHQRSHHPEGFEELWLTRLWPLQELYLSKTLQFVVCENDDEALTNHLINSKSTVTDTQAELRYKFQSWEIDDLAIGWYAFTYGERRGVDGPKGLNLEDIEEQQQQFRKAVFHNGTISRRKPPQNEDEHEIDEAMIDDATDSLISNIYGSIENERIAGKSRDLILAIFPSCKWYVIPPNARKLPFGDLWLNAINQLLEKVNKGHLRYNVKPLVTRGMVDINADINNSMDPTSNIPMPKSFGDLCRLMFFPDTRGDDFAPEENLMEFAYDPSPWSSETQWKLETVSEKLALEDVLGIMSDTILYHGPKVPNLILKKYARPEQDIYDFISKQIQSTGDEKQIWLVLEIFLTIYEIHRHFKNALLQADEDEPQAHCYRRWWSHFVESVKEYDSPALRKLLLEFTTAAVSRLDVRTLHWTQENLEPCVLIPQTKGGNDARLSRYIKPPRILILAAKNITVGDGDQVYAYIRDGDWYLYIKARKDKMEPRVIGMVPRVNYMQMERMQVFTYEGAPAAVPTDDQDEPEMAILESLKVGLGADEDGDGNTLAIDPEPTPSLIETVQGAWRHFAPVDKVGTPPETPFLKVNKASISA